MESVAGKDADLLLVFPSFAVHLLVKRKKVSSVSSPLKSLAFLNAFVYCAALTNTEGIGAPGPKNTAGQKKKKKEE